VDRIYAVLDNLNIHSAPDVLLFGLLHPRWEFVFQPKYAAYLNLIEPWWKVLRSLALKGRRFEAWAEIEEAVERATAYWNEHRHPFVWGRRRRHRQTRRLGIAAVPNLKPPFPGWARSTPETLLLGRSPVNSRPCPPADLGREQLLNLGPRADPGCFGPSG
jgi:DDE superfamily endonuclease